MDELDFEALFREALPDIIGLLSIPSVYDESSCSETAPYGRQVAAAFAYMKEKGLAAGFAVEEYDGHALSFSFGDGPERIDIACHLDVVAADPEDFIIRVEDGRLIGRGTEDMKVATYLNFLSLKLLKDRYPDLKKQMRLVFGGDEERTMGDMRHYLAKAGMPSFAYSPDGSFPMNIGEKGALMWTLNGAYDGVIETLAGGSQCNIISPQAQAVLKDDTQLAEIKDCLIRYHIDGSAQVADNKTIITVKGVGGHASRPECGHNATIDLLRVIAQVYGDATAAELYRLFADSYGRGFSAYVSEEKNESLTVNLGILQISSGQLYAQIDCRYPFRQDSTVLTERLQKLCHLKVSLDYDDPPTLCEINDPYVQTLLQTYREVSGDLCEPGVSGGVSYAKVFGHCVTFGMSFPWNEEVAHQKGEYVVIADCIKAFAIYYRTLEKLIRLEV